jgi:hypothetical protein
MFPLLKKALRKLSFKLVIEIHFCNLAKRH